MQIKNNNNIRFNGIKLSSTKLEDVQETVSVLKRAGFLNLGFKKVYCSNTFNDKIKYSSYIRQKSGFFDREFGTVIFPWSNEAYIVASPTYEQLMFPLIKQYDKNAVLNLLI